MSRRLLPHPLLSLLLVTLWLLLVNDLSFGHLLLGALLGWGVPLYTARFWPEKVHIYRPVALLRFLLVVLYDIVVANIAVARLVLGPVRDIRPAFIEMPLELHSEVGISLLANTISLTPGTVSTYVSRDRRTLVIHSLHTHDRDEIIATIRQRYETPLKEIFEPC
jgi:multicomponent K+:H+ antiporter subunit E